jgi:hypothetical protein
MRHEKGERKPEAGDRKYKVREGIEHWACGAVGGDPCGCPLTETGKSIGVDSETIPKTRGLPPKDPTENGVRRREL